MLDLNSTWQPIELTCLSNPPPNEDFSYDAIGDREPIVLWLFDEILEYLQNSQSGLVLLEDIVSEPDEKFYKTHPPPPYLFLEDEVFWPIYDYDSGRAHIEEIKSWCGAFQEIYLFTEKYSGFSLPLKTTGLCKEKSNEISSSITRIIVKVFQGGGYLDWKRSR